MEYTKLGKTGATVSRICLGCMSYGDKKWRDWVLTSDEARQHFQVSLEAGVNFFDTADVYSQGVSEEVTGRWLAEMASRDEVVIATKVHGPMGTGHNRAGLSRKHILEACDASLRRLKTDFIDLYQIHRFDYETPIEETLEALDDVVRAGKALYIGASSMFAWQFQQMLHVSDTLGLSRFITMQNHYNLVYREEEREMIPLCRDQGIGLIPWSPLARGFLAGNRNQKNRGETVRAKTDEFAHGLYYRDSDFTVVDQVTEIAQKRGVSNAQIALAWMLAKPEITAPIIGASKPHHLDDALAALEIHLNADEIKALEEPYEPHPILGHS